MSQAAKLLILPAFLLLCHNAFSHNIYEKDNVSLGLDLRVNATVLSPNYNSTASRDSGIKTYGRFGIGGKSKVHEHLGFLFYTQFGYAPGLRRGLMARDQYVGVDFKDYGLIKIGRFTDASNYAENVTEHWMNAGETSQGRFKGKRRGSQITYILDNNPYYLRLGVQFAEDNARMISFDTRHQKVYDDKNRSLGFVDSWAVESGYNLALGYRFSDVFKKPLSLRFGYSYLKGQDVHNDLVKTVNNKKSSTGFFNDDFYIEYTKNGNAFENFEHMTLGVGYGDIKEGLYLGAMAESATIRAPLMIKSSEITTKGFEFLISYAFSNGISTRIGYEATFWTWDFSLEHENAKFLFRRIPLLIVYNHSPNFMLFAECGFNAGSSHYYYDDRDFPVDRNRDSFVWSAGLRFDF